MVNIQELHKYFKKHHVLKGIDLKVEEGETVAVIGASGSGKSTLLRCINLLETPTSGRITIDDIQIEASNIDKISRGQIRKSTGMVFQNYNLFANKTARENITAALVEVKKMSKTEADGVADGLLKKVGLETHANHYPSGLSGGQQQRVGIARALAINPKVLLLDEPTSALDPELVYEVLAVIKAVSKERMTMLIVTHELEFARDVSDRIVFMDDGVIVEQNTADEFFTNIKHERTKKFLEKFLQPNYTI